MATCVLFERSLALLSSLRMLSIEISFVSGLFVAVVPGEPGSPFVGEGQSEGLAVAALFLRQTPERFVEWSERALTGLRVNGELWHGGC